MRQLDQSINAGEVKESSQQLTESARHNPRESGRREGDGDAAEPSRPLRQIVGNMVSATRPTTHNNGSGQFQT